MRCIRSFLTLLLVVATLFLLAGCDSQPSGRGSSSGDRSSSHHSVDTLSWGRVGQFWVNWVGSEYLGQKTLSSLPYVWAVIPAASLSCR